MSEVWTEADLAFMNKAIELAEVALRNDEVPVGAVVVSGASVVGSGCNGMRALHDPSAHAEIVALREAGQSTANYRLPGATLYVTLEPCVMCMGALLHARVQRLVFGAYDVKAGAAGSVIDLSTERSLNHRLEVNGGLQDLRCVALLQEFFDSKRSD